MSAPRPARPHRLAPLMVLGLLMAGCGAGDALPPEVIPPAARCAPVDTYLDDLYAVSDAGELDGLATALRERFPEDTRRDFIDAVLRLLGGFEPGSFTGLAASLEQRESRAASLQVTLGRVVRWLVEPAPRLNTLALGRRVVGTCEGPPVLRLLARALDDTALIDAALALLSDPELQESLGALNVEGERGREALSLLVRNVLVAASQPSFRVETVLDLLSFLVDLDAHPYDALAAGIIDLLDPTGLSDLQGFLTCLGRVDPELVLGGSLYDLLTAGVLSGAGELLRPGTSAPTGLLSVARQALSFLAEDERARRGLASAVSTALLPEIAPEALDGAAALLQARALTGVLDLVLDLVTGACRR